MQSLTRTLLSEIGSPFLYSKPSSEGANRAIVLDYAKKNRMPQLYLRSLYEKGVSDSITDDYEGMMSQWYEIEFRVKKVMYFLNNNGIEYVTFKSMKPYREVTVDIDLLILSNYERCLEVLTDAGYKLLERGPLSSTFRDPEFKIDYDIYDEVGVSHIIYYDKEKVEEYIYHKPLQTGDSIPSYTPVADLLAVIGHSVIKEQIYLLAEYYTTLYYLRDMTETDIDLLLDLAERLSLKEAAKTHLCITEYIYRTINGDAPPRLSYLVEKLGINKREITRLEKSDLKMPHKFHALTLAKCFLEKLGEAKAFKSMTRQLIFMMNPRFTKSFLSKFIKHVTRETY